MARSCAPWKFLESKLTHTHVLNIPHRWSSYSRTNCRTPRDDLKRLHILGMQHTLKEQGNHTTTNMSMDSALRSSHTSPTHCLHIATRWVRCLQDEIRSTLKVRIGTPPEDAVRFRRYLVAISIKRDVNSMKSLLDLSLLPNGDWRDHSSVEVYIEYGIDYDQQLLADNVSQRMTRALAPRLYGIIDQDMIWPTAFAD